jgi:glyoxylase I family protein
MTDLPFTLTALDHVVLRVPDMERALAFYSRVLGATEERRVDAIGLVQLRVGKSMIDLVDVNAQWLKAQGAKPFTPDVRNVDHVCIRIDPFKETAIEAHLKDHGVAITERGARYGAEGSGPSVYFLDPFGTVIELKGPPTPVEVSEPIIKTERLILRPMSMRDAPALLSVFQDEESMRFWAHGPIETLEEMHDIIARNLPPRNKNQRSFAITTDGERALGCLNFYNEHNSISGLGYIIGRPLWGKGYVSEAVNAAVDYGFTTLKLLRLWLEIDPRNTGSCRVAEKCGFKHEGIFRKSFFLDGQYFDSTYYAMLYDDWLARND